MKSKHTQKDKQSKGSRVTKVESMSKSDETARVEQNKPIYPSGKTNVEEWIELAENSLQLGLIPHKDILHMLFQEGRNEVTEELAESHFQKSNHQIGCELESYTNILFYRGLKKEHDMLLELASRLK